MTNAETIASTFNLMRRALRPSAVARLLWLAVVVLHTALVARRVACGEWGGALDAVRGVLCLGGVVYGSLKFWKIATILDSAPRRALAFALVLLLGHWLLAAPAQTGNTFSSTGQLTVAVLIVAPAIGVGLAMATAAVCRVPAPRLIAVRHTNHREIEALPLAVSRRSFFIFRRPPPFSF